MVVTKNPSLVLLHAVHVFVIVQPSILQFWNLDFSNETI